MNKYYNILQILVIIMTIKAVMYNSKQPPYQISLYVRLHPRSAPIHLCNGIIVESRLILTTASCVHYKFSSSNIPVVAIEPAMITAVCGSSTAFTDEWLTQVTDIFVAENFNYSTGENDLALLRLSDKLPLDTRNDMSWIILDDAKNYDEPCLANFYIRNSINGAPNYIQSEQLPLLDSKACWANFREADICSYYYLPAGFNLNTFETLQHYNGDRGTGLLCDNKLVGILSTILPPQNDTDSMEKPFKAYYTSLTPHLTWIFEIITAEDFKLLDEGDYISSSPYAGESNAFVQTEAAEDGSTLAVGVNNITSSTQTLHQHNSSGFLINNQNYSSMVFVIYLLVQMMY